MLPRQVKEIQFDSGMNTKGDRRAQPEQLLDIAVNVEFDDVGGLRARFPFDTVRTALVGGGTLTNPRRLSMLDDELVCFTDTALYSWIPSASAWQYRGDHLAVATDEQTVFAEPGDQPASDRAELNGQIVYCWQKQVGAEDLIFVAVTDKASGAVVQPATIVASVALTGYVQPRLVSLNSSVLLFWITSPFSAPTTLNVGRITLGPFAFTAAGSPVGTNSVLPSKFCYDVCRIPGQDRCYAALMDSATPAGYTITSVDSSFSGAQTSRVIGVVALSSPIAIAVSPDSLFATVIWGEWGTSLTVFADVWNVTAAGTPLTAVGAATGVALQIVPFNATELMQVTAAYRLTQNGGQYRCYAFWSTIEQDNAVFPSYSNWVDATGATGATAPFVYALGIGARAFARDSHVYLVGTFAGLSFAPNDPTGTHSELQNTYYLYRDDGFLVAKAVWGEGGGFQPSGWLPNVSPDADDPNAFVFMGSIRRLVPVGSNALNTVTGVSAYAERAPREVTFTFDDNRARRSVQFGSTLYVMGGILLQYDGVQLAEVGFTSYPWIVSATAGSSGAIAAAGYSYKATDRWANAKGEIDRSTTATVDNYTLGSTNSIVASTTNIYITRKTGVAVEVWRTVGAPPEGAPFFLVTSPDPSVNTGNNVYLTNDPTSGSVVSVTDNIVDAALIDLAANPENGAVLSNIEPPPATIVYTDNQRMYLAGIPGYPNTVYYSKYRQPGLVAAFNDALTFDTPTDGGAITAIDALDGTLIIWCETATFAFGGVGFDDTGGGSNFQLARILSTDLGAESAEAHRLYDDGFMVKTAKGFFLLDRSLTYHYVGGGPFAFDHEPVLAMIVLTSRHQVRALTANRMLVFDTLVSQWAQTSVSDGLDMLLWNGQPAYLNASGVRAELATWDGYAGDDASLTMMDFEQSWQKFGTNLQGRAIVDFVQLLGEFRSNCIIRKRLARDYQATSPGVWNYTTDETWTPSPGTVGSVLQVRQSPRYKRCEALKARFTVTNTDGVSPLAGPCARFTGTVTQYALEPNSYGAISSSQKQ